MILSTVSLRNDGLGALAYARCTRGCAWRLLNCSSVFDLCSSSGFAVWLGFPLDYLGLCWKLPLQLCSISFACVAANISSVLHASVNQALPWSPSQVKACPTGPGPAVHSQQMAAQSAHIAWATRGPPDPHANPEARAQRPNGEIQVQMVSQWRKAHF